jgi:hypothetical protein
LLLLILLPPARPAAAGEAFSFIALGDSRQHYYLPGGESDRAALLDVFPKKKKYARVRFFFDPVSGQLAWARLTPGRGGPAMTITYRDGWPQVMREQVPGRGLMVTMRAAGRRWVFDQVAGAIIDGARKPGGPGFALHTGDVVVWGGQGASLMASPYWQRFKSELLDRLPPVTPKLGLPGRLFLALGNHELYDDPGVIGAVTTLPGLAKLGFSSQRRIYSFTHKGCRFIFLDTGRRQKGDWWHACCPPREEQFAQLVKWLDQAVAEKARQVFVAFHIPVFCLGGRGGMPPAHSPHPILKRYAQRLSITVFNGDVHTTEAYLVDGVRYLVLGGAGAPQKLAQPRPKPGYPRELYWRGAPRVEEYNYAMVKVADSGLSIDLHRFRPTQPQRPSGLVRVFPPPAR